MRRNLFDAVRRPIVFLKTMLNTNKQAMNPSLKEPVYASDFVVLEDYTGKEVQTLQKPSSCDMSACLCLYQQEIHVSHPAVTVGN